MQLDTCGPSSTQVEEENHEKDQAQEQGTGLMIEIEFWKGALLLEEVEKRLGIDKITIYLDSATNNKTGLRISTGMTGGFVVDIFDAGKLLKYVELKWAADTKKVLVDPHLPVSVDKGIVEITGTQEEIAQARGHVGNWRRLYRRGS